MNDPELVRRAEIIREKGTDRDRFFRGEVDKYTWQDIGSSFLPSDITAAFLWAQLEEAQRITRERLVIWQRYHELLAPLEQQGLFRRPIVPSDCQHNGHMYYILLEPEIERQPVLDELKRNEIGAGVSLRSVALFAGRNAFRSFSRRPFVDDVVISAAGQASDVAWSGRSPTRADRRCIKYLPATIENPSRERLAESIEVSSFSFAWRSRRLGAPPRGFALVSTTDARSSAAKCFALN